MAETIDIRELNERIERQSAFVTNLTTGMDQVIVGQKHLVESLLIGLLSDGHVLLEGVPGLAKTLAIKTLASLIDAQYSRIQFTPDLLPADVIGTMVYSQKDETFQVKKGPVFANFVLADEINRAPAKYRVLCWKPCRNVKLLSAMKLSGCPNHSWCLPHRILSSRKVLIRCPKRKWTVSC